VITNKVFDIRHLVLYFAGDRTMSNIVEWYEKQSDRLRLIFVIISGLALATSLTFSWTGNADKIALFDPAWIAIVLCGLPIVLGAIVGLV